MAFRRIVTLDAWVVCLAGIVFTGWGLMLLPLAIRVTPFGWATVAVFLFITIAYCALLYAPKWRIRVPA